MGISANTGYDQARARALRWRLTVDDYHRMGDAGIFHEDDRVELVDGELFRMASIGTPHAAIVIRLNSWFGDLAHGRFLVSSQNPIRLSRYDEPQPDLMLLRPRADGYFSSLPAPDDVMLLIEVADSSLEWDRDVKIPMYGRRGVIESWLVDLEHRTVTVYRDPSPEGYRSTLVIREGTISSSSLGDVSIALDELFRYLK
ncbi:MAG TPA: Uma2 family endonuclease [Burkholderiaceae bacterium]|jgi:Uma2 family endonuclease|nr:Uma2 family endonuclease [Burkholderiaceae bacterium]